MNLKKTILLLSLAALAVAGCKKDKSSTATPKIAFDKITYTDITGLESKMTSKAIAATSAAGISLKAGAVILYKTNAGNYGKLKVVNNEGSLTIDLITYKPNDTVINKPGLIVTLTNTCDLDTGVKGIQGIDDNIADFHWTASDSYYFAPKNDAIFYLYSN